jgi:predicted dehydrogenase
MTLPIALVGCGKIADQHVLAIRRIPDCRIVAVCDREPLMARQLAERFGIPAFFAEVAEMLRVASPQVVHITTPPQSHLSLARQCLEARCHVYIEKPFTVTAEDAETLIALAQDAGVKITAGHNYQFTLEMQEMRGLVAQGFLGGPPVHLESYWPYDLGDLSYVGPLLGSRDHWVRRLPGQLLHNLLSHGIARLAEFLDDDLTELRASAQQSPRLRELGGQEVLDELRVLMRDGRGTTAFFCFSTQIKPGVNQLRLYGLQNSITVDVTSGSVIRHRAGSHKSYLTYLVPPLASAREHLRSAVRNVASFLSQRLHQDSGIKELIERFYRSLPGSEPPPLPYREIVLTARIMDRIFAQIYGAHDALGHHVALGPR